MMNPYSTPNDKNTPAMDSEAAHQGRSYSCSLEETMETGSLPFVPQLPDAFPLSPLPLRGAALLAPRKPKDGFPNKRSLWGSNANELSLLGMVSFEMAQQCSLSNAATNTQLPALEQPEADQIPDIWRQAATTKEDLGLSICNSHSFPTPTCVKDCFASPRPSLPKDSLPDVPSWAQSRQELMMSPCAPTPRAESAAPYRLPRRDPGRRPLKGRHCLLLPQL